MPILEGVSNDVFVLIVTLFLIFLALVYVCLSSFFEDPDVDITELMNEQNPPPVHNSNMCPVCRGPHVLALETNCGHLYCGLCLMTLYERDLAAPINGIRCPLCRSQVTLLFLGFTHEERSEPIGTTGGDDRRRICVFTRRYNKYHSNRERTMIDRIREIPILLRHFFAELMDTGVGNFYLSLRLYVLVVIGVLYLIIPIDMVPESIFGIVGLIDDVILIAIFSCYLATVYRHYISGSE